jgi:hypothetical protein
MSETPINHFSKKCEILGDLWLNYRASEQFEDFIEYNDIGLPLAYAFANEIAKPTGIAEQYIEETYSLFLEALEIEDEVFDSLDEMLDSSGRFRD